VIIFACPSHVEVMRTLLRLQFVRYVLVGIGNTLFSYGAYVLFLLVGFDYRVANLLALAFGVAVSFKMHGRLVFNNSNNRLFWRFALTWTLIYLATITLIGRFIAYGLDAYVSGALALPFSTALSYLSQKYFVFRAPSPTFRSQCKTNSEKSP
jgi:putative flippase GtrA